MRRLLILAVLLGATALAQEPSTQVFPDEGAVTGEQSPDASGNYSYPADNATATAVTPRPNPPRPGQLISFWKFEGDSVDEIGPYTAIWQNGSEQYIAGMDGQAAKFDGSNNYALASVSAAQMGDAPDFTIALWLYINDVGDGTITVARLVNSGTQYNFLLVMNPVSNFIRARVMESNTVYWTAEPAPGEMTQTWSFFALTWEDSTETGILYQGYDGAALVTTNLTEVGAFTNRRLDADQFRIGWLTTAESWLDEFRHWKAELSAREIDILYAAGPP